jgi:tripartite-type tricarboxylate transporter receptor subunit TctC
MAPRGLPARISDVLARAVMPALQRPELRKAFDTHGALPHASTADEFRAFVARDIEVTKKAIALAGVQPE